MTGSHPEGHASCCRDSPPDCATGQGCAATPNLGTVEVGSLQGKVIKYTYTQFAAASVVVLHPLPTASCEPR